MLFAVNITDEEKELFDSMKNKDIVFSMGDDDQDCSDKIKAGVMPRYSVVAVKI